MTSASASAFAARSLAFSFGVFSRHVSLLDLNLILFFFFFSGSAGGRNSGAGISSSVAIGHRLRTAEDKFRSRCAAAGMEISLAATLFSPVSVTKTEKVAHAHEHRLAIARTTDDATSSNRGCSSSTDDTCECCATALSTPIAAPTAPSHEPSFGMEVFHPDHAPPYGDGEGFSFDGLRASLDGPFSFSASGFPSPSGDGRRFVRFGGATPSVSTTTAICMIKSLSCAVRSCRQSLGRDSSAPRRANVCGASRMCKSSKSARRTCNACVHTTVPPAAPAPSPAFLGVGRCVRIAAMNPLMLTSSASAADSAAISSGVRLAYRRNG